MKKFVVLVLSLFISVCVLGITACGNVEFKLNFVVDNEVYATVNTSGAETIKMPENPTKDDYTFDGWFWDKDVWEKPFTANSLLDAPLSSDMSVYAKFTKNHTHEYTPVVTEPTCTEKGYTTYTCSCNDSYIDNYVDELGHDYGAWATNNNGTHTKTCINDNTHKETKDCNGGTATCQAKAVCVDCNSAYGNFANCNPDTEWTATETHHYHACKTQGCNEKLDNEKHTFDKNKKCTVCDYITTALMGTEISSDIYEIDGTNLFVKVPNSQTNFTFAETIEVAENATYRVFTDINCKEIDSIPSYAVNDLNIGDNTYYFLVSNGNAIPKVYTITVRRRPMHTVTFNTNGGTSVQNQTIEEDGFATEPTTTKTGYTFAGWDYDFNKAITDNTTIPASWNINQYTLTIKYNNGQEDLVLKQDYNTDIQTIANPEKTGYTFTGWDKTIPNKMPAEDITINAGWEINQYTLRIVYGNGQEDLVLKQDYDTAIQTITNPERAGYIFTGWDKTIPNKMPAKNLTINATWQANENTPYRVEYYFENVDDDNYSIDNNRSYNTVGKTDNTASITPETIEHFTLNRSMSVLSGNIDAKETLVLKVYYTRNRYTLSINDSTVGSITSAGSYKYGSQPFESNVILRNLLGYEFVGWYGGEEILSTDLTYIFTITQDVVAKFDIKQEMANFKFTATTTTCKITGIKDKTVTEIVVPDYVTEISKGAFSGCSKLVNITIPFVGAIAGKTASNTYQYPFGYIFGTSSYDGGTKTEQYYYGSSTSSTTYSTYYIPTSLKSVTITGGYIPYGAFYNCSKLTSIEIPDSVTSIGEYAFRGCSSLTSITLPFVGASKTASNGYDQVFGYIFGYKNLSSGSSITGAIYQYDDPNSSSYYKYYHYYVPNSLKSVTITGGNISYHAFYNCGSLTSIVIPDSVTNIGDSAFYNCSSLTNIVIPDSVESIGSYAFYNCDSLTSIVIPNSVTSIGGDAFLGCSSLTIYCEVASRPSGWNSSWSGSGCPVVWDCNYNEVATDGCVYIIIDGIRYSLKNDVATVSKQPKNILGDIIIPSSVTYKGNTYKVTSIGEGAFSGCSSLTSIEIPNSVTSIGGSAFENCSSLTSVVIPDSVESIGSFAFAYCSSLTSIEIPNSVTSIGSYAFAYCSSLTSIIIPDSVKSVGYSAFSYCSSLQYNIKNELKYLGNSSNPYLYLADTVNTSITTANIDSNCKFIGDQAFEECHSLTNIEIPNSVTSIGDYAFYNCDSLASIVISNSVTSIGDYAFYNCSSLKSVTIGTSVESIGSRAFYYCGSLTSIKYRGTEEQWLAISKGSGWNTGTGSYTITYNYTGE